MWRKRLAVMGAAAELLILLVLLTALGICLRVECEVPEVIEVESIFLCLFLAAMRSSCNMPLLQLLLFLQCGQPFSLLESRYLLQCSAICGILCRIFAESLSSLSLVLWLYMSLLLLPGRFLLLAVLLSSVSALLPPNRCPVENLCYRSVLPLLRSPIVFAAAGGLCRW